MEISKARRKENSKTRRMENCKTRMENSRLSIGNFLNLCKDNSQYARESSSDDGEQCHINEVLQDQAHGAEEKLEKMPDLKQALQPCSSYGIDQNQGSSWRLIQVSSKPTQLPLG